MGIYERQVLEDFFFQNFFKQVVEKKKKKKLKDFFFLFSNNNDKPQLTIKYLFQAPVVCRVSRTSVQL